MTKRKLSRRAVASLLLLAVSIGCASRVAPGEDPTLVRAQQAYELARDTGYFLFRLELSNRKLIESLMPGARAKVDPLRRTYKAILPRMLAAIDQYKMLKDARAPEFLVSLAMVEQLLRDVQAVLAEIQPRIDPVAPETATDIGDVLRMIQFGRAEAS